MVASDFRTNPKLAFPHSSSFANSGEVAGLAVSASADATRPSITTTRPTVFKPYEPSWKRQPNPNSYLHRHLNKASETTSNPTSTTTTTLQSQYSKKPAVSGTAPSLAAKPPSYDSVISVNPLSKSDSPPTSLSSGKPSPQETSSSPVTMSSPSSVSSPSSDKPALSPTSLKQSTKPPTAARPVISKPILQNATPNAANLIAKAPSTGVSQSSILAKEKAELSDPFKPPRDRARRAVFR